MITVITMSGFFHLVEPKGSENKGFSVLLRLIDSRKRNQAVEKADPFLCYTFLSILAYF